MAKTDRDMMNDAGRVDDALESFFAAARDEVPQPSDGLMARIMVDAEMELAAHAAPAAAPRRAPRLGVWAAITAAFGGWPALAGMATATVAGVWLGFASPDDLNTLSGGVLLPASDTATYELEDMLPGYGALAGLVEEG